MSWIPTAGRPPIGLDVGRRQIKAVQLGRARGRAAVTGWAHIDRAEPDAPIDLDEVRRLSCVLSRQGFDGRRVVLAAPAEQLMSAVLDMPPRESGAPYDVIASQEFARLQSLEPGAFEAAWWDIPRPTRASSAKVMTVGCAHADTGPLLGVFESGGLDVVAMDFGLCAAVRAVVGQLGPPEAISAVLDMGWGSARLALVHQGTVVFDRTFPSSGLASLRGRVCKALGVEPAEAECLLQSVGLVDTDQGDGLTDARAQAAGRMIRPVLTGHLDEIAQELKASFEYASHQYPQAEPHSLVVAGGGGAIPGVAGHLDTVIGPRVLCADTPGLAGGDRAGAVGEGALMAVAFGLAKYHDQG
jgi:type IV pilus assembly protein PilM